MMKNLTIEIENLKCGGCENSIITALTKLNGVHKVRIDQEQSTVHVSFVGTEALKEKAIEKKLAQMGYPKKGTGNRFQKATSYVSCAIGKITETASA